MSDLFNPTGPLTERDVARQAKPRRQNGYAARPGTGPKGETCRSCKHPRRIQLEGKAFRKCILTEPGWTRGKGTDILLRSAACVFWEGGE